MLRLSVYLTSVLPFNQATDHGYADQLFVSNALTLDFRARSDWTNNPNTALYPPKFERLRIARCVAWLNSTVWLQSYVKWNERNVPTDSHHFDTRAKEPVYSCTRQRSWLVLHFVNYTIKTYNKHIVIHVYNISLLRAHTLLHNCTAC